MYHKRASTASKFAQITVNYRLHILREPQPVWFPNQLLLISCDITHPVLRPRFCLRIRSMLNTVHVNIPSQESVSMSDKPEHLLYQFPASPEHVSTMYTVHVLVSTIISKPKSTGVDVKETIWQCLNGYQGGTLRNSPQNLVIRQLFSTYF
jgi:hypothetical protein